MHIEMHDAIAANGHLIIEWLFVSSVLRCFKTIRIVDSRIVLTRIGRTVHFGYNSILQFDRSVESGVIRIRRIQIIHSCKRLENNHRIVIVISWFCIRLGNHKSWERWIVGSWTETRNIKPFSAGNCLKRAIVVWLWSAQIDNRFHFMHGICPRIRIIRPIKCYAHTNWCRCCLSRRVKERGEEIEDRSNKRKTLSDSTRLHTRAG